MGRRPRRSGRRLAAALLLVGVGAAQARLVRARAQLAMGRPEEARTAAEALLEEAPEEFMLAHRLARCAAARTALQRAIELGSDVEGEAARRELARLDRGVRR